MALEERMNNMIGENIWGENILSENVKPIFYSKPFYGVLAQIVYLIPMAFICEGIFFKAYNSMYLEKEIIIIAAILIIIGCLVLVAMLIMSLFVSKFWKDRFCNFW